MGSPWKGGVSTNGEILAKELNLERSIYIYGTLHAFVSRVCSKKQWNSHLKQWQWTHSKTTQKRVCGELSPKLASCFWLSINSIMIWSECCTHLHKLQNTLYITQWASCSAYCEVQHLKYSSENATSCWTSTTVFPSHTTQGLLADTFPTLLQ